jgi:hypothetical protein
MDLSAKILYNDKDVKIRESGVTIKCYFFPFCNSKRIPLSTIIDVHLVNKDSYRIWGTGTFEYWFALDSKRFDYHSFVVIDNGSSMKPAFTCTDNEQAYKIIKELVEMARI